MIPDLTLESIAAWTATGAGTGIGVTGGVLFVKWLVEWIAGRMDKQADRVDRSTQKLLDRLEKEIGDLRERVTKAEAALADCQQKHAESEAKVLRLEAVIAGFGTAREHAALIIAAEKQEKT